MISASNGEKNLLIIRVRATVCALIALNQLMVTTIRAQVNLQQQQPPFVAASIIDGNNNDLASASRQASPSSSSLMPGHYEFEVAPKMEPPSVRRPPYQQSSTQTCPGSDPFAGFSPKDTLCGNLNEGRVPLNPLGQNINDQSYPFELIKNKTLQFLARALPVLKLEYETIPKVARYLPGQHLLNPTHLSSPLGHQHFHRINQQLAGADYSPLAPSSGIGISSSPYLSPIMMDQSSAGRRRRKRSMAHASYTVAAELLPNASLLVSSAHSGPGRIRDFMGHQQASSSSSGPESPLAPHPMAVITKDGYRPIAHQNMLSQLSLSSSAKLAAAHNSAGANNSTQLAAASKPALEQSNSNSSRAAPVQQQQQQQQQNKVGGHDNRQLASVPQQQSAGNTQAGQSIVPSTAQPANAQQRNHAKVTTADSGQGAAAAAASQAARSAPTPTSALAEQQNQHEPKSRQPESNKNSSSFVAVAANSSNNIKELQQQQQSSSSGLSKRRSLMSCSDSANGFSSAICQAAVALIEGNERQPVWLQMMKHLGSAFAGPSEQVAPSGAANNPLWTILSGLSAVSQAYTGSNEAQSKSAGQQVQPTSSKPNLLNLIGPITSLLAGANRPSSPKESGSSADESTHKAADLPAAPSSFGSALANSLGSSTVAKLALAGWASNAVAGLLDYFAPSLFSSASRGFARRKKPYDPLEQFVDTPASLAHLTAAGSNSVGQSRQASFSGGGQPQPAKQPPTPCPSVEEYISPTFARNYQGTWKYVIQIPHEGYFTQTIQRTSCVRQRCEFTDGVCHESPRWVSLLVAEIYYPHAVFRQPAADQMGASAVNSLMMQQQPPLSAAPSMSSIQQAQPAQQRLHQQQQPRAQAPSGQDPLQMTDSLSTYNHNLNSAFIEAANGLGLDPNNVASMQQLANAYNYDLLQRNGLLPGQANNQLESRSSIAASASATTANSNPLLGASSNQHYMIQPPANQPQQQQQQQQSQRQALVQSNANNDYILSLAAAALEQNPHLSMNDLIASLQQSLNRKRRDVGLSNRSPANSWSPHNSGHKIQQRSSASPNNPGQPVQDQAAAHPAMNEIPSAGQQQQQSPFAKANPLDSAPPAGQHQSEAPSNPPSNLPVSPNQGGADAAGAGDQTECDGHDKIGCYVVRVYYDWFLVNGSCKCWKTTGQQQQQQTGQQSGNSLIRRIFTG